MRLDASEMRRVGEVFARKASGSRGPVAVCIPTRGFSVPDSEGGPFWDPEADFEFIAAVRDGVSPNVHLELVDAHVNDDSFSDVVVDTWLSLVDWPTAAASTERSDV